MSARPKTSRKLTFLLPTALFLLGLIAAHLQVLRLGPEYRGPLLVLDHLFDLAAALALSAVCAGVGRFALARLRIELGEPLDDLIFATAVGAAITATVLLLMGLVGGLERALVGAAVLLLAALSWRELRGIPRLAASAFESLRQRSGDRTLWLFGVGAFAVAIIVMTVFALAPPVDWDSLMYHLRIPGQYLQEGRVYLPEDNLHASYIGLAHLLYVPLLAVGSMAGPAVLNVIFAGLLGLAVYSLSVRLFDEKTAALSLGTLWGTTTILLVAITPRVDLAVALYLFLAHYAVLLAFSLPSDRKPLLLAAALLGFAVGTKYTALPYLVGLAPLVIWAVLDQDRSSRKGAFRSLLVFGIVVVVTALPWLIKNWLILGAPLFPFFAEPRVQPWLVPVLGSTAFPASVNANLMQFIWELREPFNLRDAFFAPGKLTIEVEGMYYYLSPAFLILPLWVLFIKDRTLNRLLIPALIYVFIVLVILPSPNLRYLIPAAVPLTIAVARMAVRSSERLFSPAAARLLLVALASLALLPSAVVSYAMLTRTRGLEHLVGTSSASEYVASRVGSAYVRVVSLANNELAPDSRILMLFDARGYYFKPSALQDNLSTNWPLLADALPADGCLESLGVTHVMLGLGSLSYYAAGGLDPERFRWSAFQRFAGRCLEPVYESPTIVLFRVLEKPRSKIPVAPTGSSGGHGSGRPTASPTPGRR